MASRIVYAAGPFRYGTRMLQAGDGPIQMSGPDVRLHQALGNISLVKPRKPKVQPAPVVETPVAAPPAASELAAADAGVAQTTDPDAAAATAFDHDGDGKAGGSAKGAKSTRAKGAKRK